MSIETLITDDQVDECAWARPHPRVSAQLGSLNNLSILWLFFFVRHCADIRRLADFHRKEHRFLAA